jgi:hypothetical protein
LMPGPVSISLQTMYLRVPASDVSPSYEFSNMIATILDRNSFVFAAICLHAPGSSSCHFSSSYYHSFRV